MRNSLAAMMLVVSTAALPTQAQVKDRDNPPLLLASQFGELCTMCVAYLRCTRTHADPDHFDLYYIQQKSFWGQLATIWDWGTVLFRDQPKSESRDVVIYRQFRDERGDLARIVLADERAHLSMRRARIEVPTGWIDRRTARWSDAQDRAIGQCTRVLPKDAQPIKAQFS